jgi:hypothetical protein
LNLGFNMPPRQAPRSLKFSPWLHWNAKTAPETLKSAYADAALQVRSLS